ncbi:MAG: molybdopterin-dependent oxidoreductase [Anaerolineales bacterium]|nr:molybdopterin-dependent oxidoreductase [Anaerolineales bacterium]
MKTPWANTILLVVLLAQVISGYGGMANNQERYDWVLWLHGIGAYALVLLLFWKGRIVWDAWRRKKRWTWARIMFLLTSFLLLLTLALGLLWTFNGPQYFLNISYVSWHIYIAVPLMFLMVWHSWKMRFVFRLPEALNRRLFLRTALLSTAGLIAWQAANLTKTRWPLPGALRRFTGSYERGSFSGRFPIVSWIFDNPAPLQAAVWQLKIHGAVKNPLTLSYEQLRQRNMVERTAILDCTGGWYTEQLWSGVSLGELLAQAGLTAEAQSVTIRAISGYQRRFTLAEAQRYLLALEVAGDTLSHGHGFPLRLVAWDKRGVEWVKWITEVEVNTTAKIWQSPLPLQ